MDSQGMKNAKRMLEKLGWSEGSGLGLNGNGITEAVKPSPKQNLAGIGHKNYNDFQWWDHAFNKAAQAFDIKVTDNQGPVVVKSKNLGNISTKKRHTNVESNQLEYGVFHKTGTLHNGVVEATASTITLKEEADYSLKLSDEDLFKLCNGLTAHKGARHGLTASGKLARIAQQEAELLAKMNAETSSKKKKKNKETTTLNAENEIDVTLSPRLVNSVEEQPEQKRLKRKKKTDTVVDSESLTFAVENPYIETPKSKKKKTSANEADEDSSSIRPKKGKMSIKENVVTEVGEENLIESTLTKEKKKRKKDKENDSETPQLTENITNFEEQIKKKKKKKKNKEPESETLVNVPEERTVKSDVKDKKKKNTNNNFQHQQDESNIVLNVNEKPNKKKKKKKRDCMEN